MPSLAISDPTTTPGTLKKEKKMKPSEGLDYDASKKSKKEKSSIKKDKEDKKKKRNREVSSSSDTSSESNSKPKKQKPAEAVSDEDVEEASTYALENFRISKPLKDKLVSKGIKALFPIQAMTFNDVFDGSDLVGRARTGQGKTLAFVLPIIESLVNGRTKDLRKTGYGRPPSVLVLLPTRELATQVLADFQVYGGALGLTACSVYGGAPFNAQITSLSRGVDIVVGTPGRVKDLLEKGILKLGSLQFRVLDEADEMLRMGFVDDVELILGKVDDVSKVQTLLFSATLPDWVKKISARFLKSVKKTVDLVSNQTMKASTSVRHIVIPCSVSARAELIPDIIRCYGSGGRSIVFTETKESASQLAGSLPGARPLHGDIQQTQREVTLKGFRSGKFMTLVATNVAARGLDINDVQLIIQCEPPRDVEDYIHRSGRTGRAGNTGVAVMLYDPKRSSVSRLEREIGVKFEHLSAPQPADVAKAAGVEAAEAITQISDSVIPAFKDAAEELLRTTGLSAVEILAKALAKAAGYSNIKERSLLTGMEGYVTLHLEAGTQFYYASYANKVLGRFLPVEKVESIMGTTLTADKNGAVFDIPIVDLETFLVGSESAAGVSLEVLKALPPLEQREFTSRRNGYGSYSRGGPKFGGRGSRGGGFSDRRSFSNGNGRGRSRW